MTTTDPIADMLTRIRNANSSKHKTVDVPASNIKLGIAEILFKEGYIKSFEEIKDDNQGIIRITLKYDEKGTRVIDGLRRISKPFKTCGKSSLEAYTLSPGLLILLNPSITLVPFSSYFKVILIKTFKIRRREKKSCQELEINQ